MVSKSGHRNNDNWVVLAQASFRTPLALLVFAALLLGTVGPSFGQDKCDNKIEVEKGEGVGPFFGFEHALYANALAEKVCGAPATSMSSKVLQWAESEGCGPGTPIYAVLGTAIQTMEEWDMEALALDGRTDREMSPDQVRDWAHTAVEEFGGCPALISFHKRLQGDDSFGR